jgi:hypothetical protein
VASFLTPRPTSQAAAAIDIDIDIDRAPEKITTSMN